MEEKRATTASLAKRGATIDELNCVRKHISAVKGGRLAAVAHSATVSGSVAHLRLRASKRTQAHLLSIIAHVTL